MLDSNKSVTVFCSWYDGTADIDKEETFTLDNVSVHVDTSVATSTGGIAAADLAKIRIPFREGYIPADQWIQRRKDSHWDKRAWTLRIGDKITVDGTPKTITRVRDNTCRRFEPHWYVEAR